MTSRTLAIAGLSATIAILAANVVMTSTAGPANESTVLLISFDGFRADYIEKHGAKNLGAFAESGVRAESLIPVFPSNTFPNHYSIITGLYPAKHGIVDNSMYDPEFDESFSIRDKKAVTDRRWWEGEPLWVTAEKQGVATGTYFWVGSEADVMGVRPTLVKDYDGSIPNRERIDTVVSWLQRKEKRPRLVTLYFSTVDGAGHRFGPDAVQTTGAVRTVDRDFGYLLEKLQSAGLRESLDIIVVSDHGMVEYTPEQQVYLDEYIDLEDVERLYLGAFSHFWPKDEANAEAMVEALQAAPHIKAYTRESMPAEFRYSGHRRIPPVMVVADPGWNLSESKTLKRGSGGTHGYDPRHPEMGAVFLASGPSFKSGASVESFENVHIYSLITEILGLDPAETDGSLDAVKHVLR